MSNILSQNEKIAMLLQFSELISSSLDINEIKRRVVSATASLVEAETGSLLLRDEATGELYFDVALGSSEQKLKTVRLREGQGIGGWVAKNNEPLLVDDPQSDPRFFSQADDKTGFVTRNILCTPLRLRERIIGVVQVINKREGAFDENDLNLLLALSNQIAIAIENARLYASMRDAYNASVHDMVRALSIAIDAKDVYTGAHCRRVTQYCRAIGLVLGLPEKQMINLKLAAILHDVGIIGVKDAMLTGGYQSPTTAQIIIREHSQHGAQILKNINLFDECAQAIKYHHEHYDGTGIPDGLQGQKIPLLARIIAVADSYDAMVFGRPYEKIASGGSAVEQLKHGAGKRFDPTIVKAFLRAYAEFDLGKIS